MKRLPPETIAALFSLILAPCAARADAQPSPADFTQRGKDLRAALEQTYAHRDSHFGSGAHGTDVTLVVLPYIPQGTAFADAETILRDAGFTIGPPPDPARVKEVNQSNDWYGVVAVIDPFATFFMGKATAYVELLPPAPGNYTKVTSLKATFFISMP